MARRPIVVAWTNETLYVSIDGQVWVYGILDFRLYYWKTRIEKSGFPGLNALKVSKDLQWCEKER
jgi:hypothetical protein